MINTTFFINLWVTFRCNFRCRYCYEKNKYADKDLNRETVDSLILFIRENIRPEQKLVINFHGGEPTLNFDMIKYCISEVKKNIVNKTTFGITTNCSFSDDSIIPYLAKNFDYSLSVSLDGKEETNKINRISIGGKVSYETIINNALKLLESNKRTRIRMTFDPLNIKNLYENLVYFIDLGFTTIVPVADYCCNSWTDSDFIQIENQFSSLKKNIYKNHLKGIQIPEISDMLYPLAPCTGGYYYYSVDTNGDLYPCTFVVGDENYVLGNVVTGVNHKIISKFLKIESQEIQECEKCALQKFCLSNRCIFLNKITTGSYFSPNLVCCNMSNIHNDLINRSLGSQPPKVD